MDKHIMRAVFWLGEARDDLLAFGHSGKEPRKEMAIDELSRALSALGYTLTPIFTPSPDSGCASADIFQSNEA